MEGYKHEFHKLPQEHIHAEFNFRDAFPGLPGGKKKKDSHSKDDSHNDHHWDYNSSLILI